MRHIFWTDWAEYHVVCGSCYSKIKDEQWCGHTGYHWSNEQKLMIKAEAELFRQQATHCDECGCALESEVA